MKKNDLVQLKMCAGNFVAGRIEKLTEDEILLDQSTTYQSKFMTIQKGDVAAVTDIIEG